MRYNKTIAIFVIFLINLHIQSVKGQSLNINGDTISVNMEAEVQIIFPTRPTTYSTIPVRTQFHIWDVKTGIYLIPVKDDYTPVTLLVSESGRNHRFILVYKRDISIDDTKLYYDYSTVDKLAQHIRQQAITEVSVTAKSAINVAPVKEEDQKKKDTDVVKLDSSLNYYALLEEGDKELKLKNYHAAFLTFGKAHTLRAEDPFPLQRLGELKRLIEKQNAEQAEIEKKYNVITAAARDAFNKKKYAQALQIYKRALELKPGDANVTQQLQTISDLVLKATPQKPTVKKEEVVTSNVSREEKAISKKQQLDEDNYQVAIKSADSYFMAGNYDSAKALYAAALIFSKKDWPQSQISRIDKINGFQATQVSEDNKGPRQLKTAPETKSKVDSVLPVAESKKPSQQLTIAPETKLKTDSVLSPAAIKKNYNLAMANAKSSYVKNDFLNAKIFYEEAINLQPLQQDPKNQLKIINNKLDEIARQIEIDSNYERTIDLADSQVNAKAYESSVITYREASAIKPMESYPKKQLKYIESEIASIEKRKREEREQQYSDALVRADKAVADKNYDEARSAYTEVLSIHPENDYAKRRLDIVSYQVEKARLEKLVQDSLKQVVVPVKKSKRKKSQ